MKSSFSKLSIVISLSQLIRKPRERNIKCLIGKVSFSFVSSKKCRYRNKIVSSEANRAAEERECRRWRISVELFRSFFIFIDCHYNNRQVFKAVQSALLSQRIHIINSSASTKSKAISITWNNKLRINEQFERNFVWKIFTLNCLLTIKRLIWKHSFLSIVQIAFIIFRIFHISITHIHSCVEFLFFRLTPANAYLLQVTAT